MKFLLSLLLSCLVTISFAQVDKSNHALLWEISGNGLEKPSYLFGTMHVQDERGHEFSDSTLLCLDATDAFAMEVNFDSIIYDILQIYLKGDTTNVLKGMLSPEAYGRLNEKMIKQTGKSIEENDNKDPQYLQDLLMDWEEPDYTVKKDQMVDLYLMKRAAEQGHRTYGLEKMEDYLGVTESYFKLFENEYEEEEPTDEEKNAFYEKLVDIYQRGDLAEIEATFVNKEERTAYDVEMLDKRNKKMVTGMMRLMKTQTIFCAVGTAHLPGKEGMLEELKRQGYQVRKVKADFEGYADAYEKTVSKTWGVFDSQTHLYKIKAPGMTMSLSEQVKELGVDASAHMNLDILDQQIYIHMVMNISEMRDDISEGEIEKAFVENWVGEDSKLEKTLDTTRSGIKGKRLYTKDEEGGETVWEVFVRGKLIYVFSVVKEGGSISEENAEAYFSSIEFTDQEWKKYESEQGAFTVELPVPPKENRISSERESGQMILKSLMAVDPSTSISYLVRYSNMNEGSTIINTKESSMSIITAMTDRFGTPNKTIDSLNYKGYFTYKVNFELQESFFEICVFNRANRGMLLGIEYPKTGDHSKERQRFFESLELLPFQNSSLRSASFEEGDYSIDFPGTVVKTYAPKEVYPFYGEYGYSTIDSMHSGNFDLDIYHMNPFYMPTSKDSSVVNFSKVTFEDKEGRVIVDTVFQGRKAAYIRAQNQNVDTKTYELLFYEGSYFFDLTVYLSSELSEAIAWKYFNTFKASSQSGTEYLLKNKKDRLFNSLTGKDTVAFKHAIKAMDYVEFSPADLSEIYKIIAGKLPEDNERRQAVKSVLVRELRYTKDQTTFPFMEKLFYENKNDRELQIEILNTLASIPSESSFDLFFKLGKDLTEATEINFTHANMFSNFIDTMSLSKSYVDPMFSMTDDPSFSYYVYDFYLKLCRNDAGNIEQIKPHLPKLLAQANQIISSNRLTEAKDSINQFDLLPHFQRLNALFGYFKESKEVGAYYQKIKNIPDPNLLVNIIDAMLMRGAEVPISAFEKVATVPYYWKSLLDATEFEKTLDKIPAHLFTPEKTVESTAAQQIKDDNGAAMLDFKIIDTRNHTLDGVKLNLYTFTFGVSGYEGTYLGICSQPIGKAQVFGNYFDYNSKQYEADKKEALIAEFLAAWEE